MDFSSILVQNTRLMAVLRNLFALQVSVDVVYCQHAWSQHAGVSCETKEERTREGSTREDSFQLVSIFTAYNYFQFKVFLTLFLYL